jgi:uncharacterized protein
MRRKYFIFITIILSTFLINKLYSQENSWDKKGKEFVNLLNGSQYETAVSLMSDIMKGYLPKDKLQKLWDDLEKQLGEFQAIENIKIVPVQKWFQVNVTCRFVTKSFIVRIVFNQENLVDGLFFVPVEPPKYVTPDNVNESSFKEEEIKFGLPNWKLPGTLTIPNGDGPFPAIILVHGSGPNDRDETIGPNKPFRDLAWGLASKGIAVFRYDKRTKVHGSKMTEKSLTVEEEVIEDVLSAVQLVKDRPEINKNKIFVLGHSLGAMLAPEIGTRSNQISGIIMLAAPARPMEELISYQLKYLQSLKPVQTEEEKAQLDSTLHLLKQLKNETLADSVNVLGIRAYYFYDFHKRNQIKFAKLLKIPALFLQGERDYQVTMTGFYIWQKELENYKNFSFISYPMLNHLFIAGTGKSTPEEYMDKQKHVAPEVIKDIAKWIKNQIQQQ